MLPFPSLRRQGKNGGEGKEGEQRFVKDDVRGGGGEGVGGKKGEMGRRRFC